MNTIAQAGTIVSVPTSLIDQLQNMAKRGGSSQPFASHIPPAPAPRPTPGPGLSQG